MPKFTSLTPLTEEDFYEELIASIPSEERDSIIAALDSETVIARAKKLEEELAKGEMIGADTSESRILFLAACRNVRDKKMSIAQLASIHILDSAIQTLYLNPMVFLIHSFVDAEKEVRITRNLFALTNLRGMPSSFSRYNYKMIILPNSKTSISDLPWRMRKPLVQRFFNMTDTEWAFFCEEMEKAPKSEQSYHVLVAPEAGCLSGLLTRLQKILKCMQILDWFNESTEGPHLESIMVVPSFTMFQAALNAKAHCLKRQSVEFVPTYGYIEPEHYAELKKAGKIALALYLPEESLYQRYRLEVGRFRTRVDGHPVETAFVGAIHDVYHGMREISMSENVAQARMHLASIAKNHPKNIIEPGSPAVDDILIHGELICSYPPAMDTMIDPDHRAPYPEMFGHIFNTFTLKGFLHDDLRRDFIKDMVKNQKMWQERFSIGRADLLPRDQAIYDTIQTEMEAPTIGAAGGAGAAPCAYVHTEAGAAGAGVAAKPADTKIQGVEKLRIAELSLFAAKADISGKKAMAADPAKITSQLTLILGISCEFSAHLIPTAGGLITFPGKPGDNIVQQCAKVLSNIGLTITVLPTVSGIVDFHIDARIRVDNPLETIQEKLNEWLSLSAGLKAG